MTIEELFAMRADLMVGEGKLFMGLPDRWFEAPGPKFRCINGHVSRCILKTDGHGDRCLGCQEPLCLTFPEDFDDPGVT